MYAILTTAAFLPQLIKTLKTKRLRCLLNNFSDVSLWSAMLDFVWLQDFFSANSHSKLNYIYSKSVHINIKIILFEESLKVTIDKCKSIKLN